MLEARGCGGPPGSRGLSSLCLHQVERPPSAPVPLILSGSLPPLWKGAQTRRGDWAAMKTRLRPRPSPVPSSYRVRALAFCLCPSVPAWLLSARAPDKSVAPRGPRRRAPMLSPPFTLPAALLCNGAVTHQKDALRSICRTGRPFIWHCVLVMGPDRGPLNC